MEIWRHSSFPMSPRLSAGHRSIHLHPPSTFSLNPTAIGSINERLVPAAATGSSTSAKGSTAPGHLLTTPIVPPSTQPPTCAPTNNPERPSVPRAMSMPGDRHTEDDVRLPTPSPHPSRDDDNHYTTTTTINLCCSHPPVPTPYPLAEQQGQGNSSRDARDRMTQTMSYTAQEGM